ncbi:MULTISPECIES: hypothetical protein [unclassified Endozoicomonas]|uniref:hypothetical protein n=1 Tax=unclassified Endozoicomonas TaxID=2644528 RepID=UPI00214756AD|nr:MULTISPECIES: hypothetical protein [unclassified Endozoicomonas]
MKKTYYTLAVCRFLFVCLMMQLATIPQAVAVNSFVEPVSFSSLLPLLATVYRNIPEAKNPLPDLNLPPQPAQPGGDSSCSFDTHVSVVAPQYSQIKLQLALAEGHVWKFSGDNEPLELEPAYLPSAVRYIDPTGHCHEHWVIQGVATQAISSGTDPEDLGAPKNSPPSLLSRQPDLPIPYNLTQLFADNGFDRSDKNDLDAVENPLTHLLPAPFPLSIRYADSSNSVLFQDAIWLRLNQEEALVLVPSEFPAVARVSDMSDENWPQLITAESVDSNTSGVKPVFRWANKWLLNSLSDDPLLRFLAYIYGAAFHVQDSNGQLSYIIQHNGKLLLISRTEAYLRFSLYNQSFLESLYPEIFGPSMPAGGGWHEWNRFIRKQPFHYDRPEHGAGKRPGAQRPSNPAGGNHQRNERSTRPEANAMHHSERSSEQTREPGTAASERDGRREPINQQQVEAIYDYEPQRNDDETPIPLYATAYLSGSQQHLFCPVCTELITGEARTCTSSLPHSVCIGCFKSMTDLKMNTIKECITCRGRMDDRLFNYEDTAAAIMFQCPFGCNHSCPLAFLKGHIIDHHTPVTLEHQSEPVNPVEEEQAIPPGSVLFYGVPVMPEDKHRVEQFIHTCRQINDPEHLQLAESFTRAFEALQNRCEQLANARSDQEDRGAACRTDHSPYAFFNSRENSIDSAYLHCFRSTLQEGDICRFCNSHIGLIQNKMGIQEHLRRCSGAGFCPNRDDGCSFQHQPALVPIHMSKCRFNKVNCRICHQYVATARMREHRVNCPCSVQLGQDDALFCDRTEQKPIQLHGKIRKMGTIPVFKKPGEDTYYCKISKLFYESITERGRRRGKHLVKFFGNHAERPDDFSVNFSFDTPEGSLSFEIIQKAEHRRMALPIVFNEKGEKLVDKPFVLRGTSSCEDCGCEINRDMSTHPNPYPICLDNLLFGVLCSKVGANHNDHFPECVYVQIKLTPVDW